MVSSFKKNIKGGSIMIMRKKFPYMVEEVYEGGRKRKTLGDKNQSTYENVNKPLKRRARTVNDLLREITHLKNKVRMLKVNYTLSRKRAEKWKNKYQEDLKNHDKIILENQQLRQTNHDLNLMHHQAIMKVLHLRQQLKKEKEND